MRYEEEISDIFKDGIEYDDDNSGTIDDDEKEIVSFGRLVR
jgi:hypothetical protein